MVGHWVNLLQEERRALRDVVQMLKFVDANVMLGILISNSLPKTMKIHHIIIALIVGMVLGWLCRHTNAPERVVEVQKDTVVRYDTIRIYEPSETRYEILTERILVPICDTIKVRDTLYLQLERERKSYKDKDFYVEISGYKPELDYIEVYPRYTTVTKTERVKYHPVNRLSAGAEVSYINEVYSPLYIEYERMLHRNVVVYARFLYDIPTMTKGMGLGVEFTIGW